MNTLHAGSLLLMSIAFGSAHAAAGSDAYPSKPIRIIVPAPAGGNVDIVVRPLGQKLTEAWHQSVVVDNRPGAGGALGADLAAKAPPDGYTVLVAHSGPIVIAQSLYSHLAYDPLKDLAPVTRLVTYPNVIDVHPSVPAKSVKELIALAKSHPGKLNYASTGIGGGSQLSAELFKSMTGINMVHVPYKGATPALNAVLAGEVDVFFDGLASSLPQIKSGKIRALAVTSLKRSPMLPDVPTVDEAGLPRYEFISWSGVFVPAGTPHAIVDALQAEIAKLLGERELSHFLQQQGFEPAPTTPEEFGKLIAAEAALWAKVIKASGTRIE
jgi:tripartite-type tricarboxylate transporter receptor subunit TctC